MLIDKQFGKVLAKTKRMENTYDGLIFRQVREIPFELFITEKHLRKPPEDVAYSPVKHGDVWGGEYLSGWFRARLPVDGSLSGRKLYLTARTGALETLLFINGVPGGVYASKVVVNSRGNHHTLLLTNGEEEGKLLDIALEGYCWYNETGTQPFDVPEHSDRRVTYDGIFLTEMRGEVKDFVIELRILNQLSESLPDDYRRAQVQNCLQEVYGIVPQKPEEYGEDEWTEALRRARAVMKPVLEAKNPQSAPYAGLIGHSHMDTAWLWTIDETIRKCARTYSNALSLMRQYPEYTFFQSSTYHSEMMRREYPAIFSEMKQRVEEGRYEPNGGVWVECDCNLVSGESLIRQFLWGQRWSKKYFNYRSDTFWLPDTFGYSSAIPQIMKGCDIRYFLTTKMSWNDTNTFPYDTFYWRGTDGSEVLTHFNVIHCAPDAATLVGKIVGNPNRPDDKPVLYKRVNDCRLISYGFGDGGGGPSYDMVETAIRLGDVEGCPKASHTTVSKFMDRLRDTSKDIPVYSGELYLELHRGTLTGKAEIKRNNRKAEIALHDLDFAAALAFADKKPYPSTHDLYETLLVHQFHDILPGTAIQEVNDRTIRAVGGMIRQADGAFDTLMSSGKGTGMALVNTLSWTRKEAYVPDGGLKPKGSRSQAVTDPQGNRKLYVENVEIPALSCTEFEAEPAKDEGGSSFRYDGNRLVTPCLTAVFDENGGIASLVDRASNRELRRKGGYPLNTFLLTEDVPLGWDNWDIDADAMAMLRPAASLEKREAVCDGKLQLRLRSVYSIGKNSTITQDMVFYANNPRIDFETVIDWDEKHRLLKTGFDLDVLTDAARHEIQFGYVLRNTFKRNRYEQAMFEVLNHKYTDLSETRFGVAILNDCKYGISIDGTLAALSLIKSGTHPDLRADRGRHVFTYSLLPHGGFSTENVVRPAYELNVPVRAVAGPAFRPEKPMAEVSAPNVIVETVKVAEDGDGVILRLYECEKSGCETDVALNFPHGRVFETNMLEEPIREIGGENGGVRLTFRAFEIKTLKVTL